MWYRSAIVLMTVSIADSFLFGFNLFSPPRSNVESRQQASFPPLFSMNSALGNIATLVSTKCDAINSLYRSRLERTIDKNQVRLYLYTNRGFISYKILEAPKFLLESKEFNPYFKTILFVHGYRNTPDETNVEKIAENYFKRGGYNFLSFASNVYTSDDYVKAVGLTPYLGRILAEFTMELMDRGVPYDSFHIVGYSLGAQFAGVAGRIFQRERGAMLTRITAIDPATVCFASPSRPKLTKNDAMYVDAIHTTILSFSQDNVGHADFYVNGDSGSQPGCSSISCSHTRSIIIFAETVANGAAFMASQCDSWPMFQSGGCRGRDVSLLGEDSPITSRGKYFLKTSSKSPFGLGVGGL